MSNSPFDPNKMPFPWYQPPVTPKPERSPIADWLANYQPKPSTPSLADLLAAVSSPPQPKPFDFGKLFESLPSITIRPRIFVS